jgi:hypothetical protein
MKPSGISKIAFVALLVLTSPARCEEAWRTFENADGSRSFTAKLIAYDQARETATVTLKDGGKQLTFALKVLKEEDQAFVKEHAQQLAAQSSLRFKFDKFMDETGESESGDTTVTTYNGGYRVALSSYATGSIKDVEVEHLVIWRKDSFEGMGEDQVVHGTQRLDNLIAGLTETVTINGIQMESRVKKGKSVTTGGSCPRCPRCPTSTVSTRTLRSRDLLVGCVVRIKVGGKVVRTEASSQALIKRYQAQFPSEVPAGS